MPGLPFKSLASLISVCVDKIVSSAFLYARAFIGSPVLIIMSANVDINFANFSFMDSVVNLISGIFLRVYLRFALTSLLCSILFFSVLFIYIMYNYILYSLYVVITYNTYTIYTNI